MLTSTDSSIIKKLTFEGAQTLTVIVNKGSGLKMLKIKYFEIKLWNVPPTFPI